ncbi:hypothetical protein NLJ89_g1129 [Agrocybe chaxingu]|uniref:Mitochondrial intermembrane space import and assembly protein 40 n=1 Tax=Agrocybe chaxingu TaxID=84603 RepID=A0A9W8TEX2_9AGAR|nr:hypothetical protein NLJ89_g1129 [Agrocybe chaxingu]
MFSRLTRLPLRRCLNTSSAVRTAANPFSRTAKVAIGASAVTAAYLSWRLANESNHIALDSDSPPTRPSKPSPASSEYVQKPTRHSETTPPSTPESSNAEASSSKNVDASTDPALDEMPVSPEGTEGTDGKQPPTEGGTPSQGAFNPETGEINWDCPCLGGMAHGPCGPEFREAFSCFVFSEAEPKGINCVEKFQGMQNCFRAHPDVYADEIMNDDDDEPAGTDGSNMPPPENSGEKLNGRTSSEFVPDEKPLIDGASVKDA